MQKNPDSNLADDLGAIDLSVLVTADVFLVTLGSAVLTHELILKNLPKLVPH